MILVADDDGQIRDVVRIALTQAGFAVAEAGEGRAALEKAESLQPDLVILDIGMPELDGLEVCRALRRTSQVPILFLTARGDEIDRVVGLELGADDYVSKPFSPRELVARVRAILKRSNGEISDQVVMRRGIISVDPARHLCHVNDATVTLTSREMDLLERLISRPDNVMSRPQLVDAIYGTNVNVSDRTMDSHLRNLRSKLGKAGCADAIETVHGVGIRMGACRGA